MHFVLLHFQLQLRRRRQRNGAARQGTAQHHQLQPAQWRARAGQVKNDGLSLSVTAGIHKDFFIYFSEGPVVEVVKNFQLKQKLIMNVNKNEKLMFLFIMEAFSQIQKVTVFLKKKQ